MKSILYHSYREALLEDLKAEEEARRDPPGIQASTKIILYYTPVSKM